VSDLIQVKLQRFSSLKRNETEERYACFRQLAYQHVTDNFLVTSRFKLDGIGSSALQAFAQVWKTHGRLVQWDWLIETMHWKKKQHARLELAIWHGMHLCGLMLGSTSKRKKILYIRGIEGAPYKHPLKGSVVPICIEVAEAYAALLGSEEIHILSPHPKLVPLYTKLGYNFKTRLLLYSYSVKIVD